MDRVGRTWNWLFARPADAWTATASWVAVLIGLLTVVVAGIYAKRQVDEAKGQVAEARTARLAQERQAQEALAEQARLAQESLAEQARLAQVTLDHQAAEAQRTREEQAQPNVVIFTVPNDSIWHVLELVVKNFGTTPAFDVQISFDSIPQVSGGIGKDPTDLGYPALIPILAPGQEWRTMWDYAPRRAKSAPLPSKHKASLKFFDSRGKAFDTSGLLDWDTLMSVTRIEVKTVHDVAKLLEKHLAATTTGVNEISKALANFGLEHNGIWVHGNSAQDESEHRRQQALVDEAENRRQIREMNEIFRQSGNDHLITPIPTDDETEPHSTPESVVDQTEAPAPQGE